MHQLILIAHNVRSAHNVGSLLRTADGLGVNKVYLTGYTPYPASATDTRLPHEAAKIVREIHKTALGAESTVPWQHGPNLFKVLEAIKKEDYTLCALEQSGQSQSLPHYQAKNKIALIVGNEVSGLDHAILKECDDILEIPMAGQKESLNVVQAAAIALYHLHFNDKML